ncbi:hypothetical protein F4801DRAFT_579428 [Xylaria longipes]|nr:hypothetical protein F4801DRAFT_579428 [Xylaria longipes]
MPYIFLVSKCVIASVSALPAWKVPNPQQNSEEARQTMIFGCLLDSGVTGLSHAPNLEVRTPMTTREYWPVRQRKASEVFRKEPRIAAVEMAEPPWHVNIVQATPLRSAKAT